MAHVILRRLALAIPSLALLSGTAFSQSPGPPAATLSVEGGAVRGVIAGGVISWKGVPYAAPPVGDLRWRGPQPVRPSTGVQDARRFGPACMQTDNVANSE